MVEQQAGRVTVEQDVVFGTGGGRDLKCNVYHPPQPGPNRPAVLLVHGGGWMTGDPMQLHGYGILLGRIGYVCVSTSYRLAGESKWPAQIQDVKACLRWMRANADKLGIDPDKISVEGNSAGAHLSLMVAGTANVPEFEEAGENMNQSSAVSCVVNVYGPSDFTQSYGKSVDAHEVLPLWFGGDLTTARDLHIKGSPLYWVTPAAAPTLCIHGTEDKYVAHEQAVWLVDKLKAATVEAELLTLEGAGHGFKGTDAEKAEAALFAFFEKRLK